MHEERVCGSSGALLKVIGLHPRRVASKDPAVIWGKRAYESEGRGSDGGGEGGRERKEEDCAQATGTGHFVFAVKFVVFTLCVASG